jgi:exopolysaccharide biosynthesis polyprenyl glycosylphosphotransferase
MNQRMNFKAADRASASSDRIAAPEKAVVSDGPAGSSESPFTEELLQTHVLAKRNRVLLTMGALVSDLVAAALGLLLANIIYLGGVSWDQSGSMVAVCLPIFLLFSVNAQAHWPEFVASYWKGLSKALAALFFTAASMMFIAFSLKVGAEFSRGVFLLGLALAGLIIPIGRSLITRFVARGATPRLGVTLLIRDGSQSVEIDGAISIDALAHDLRPARDTHEAVRRLGELAKYADRLVVACPPKRRASWADVFRILDVQSEIIVEEFDELAPLALSRRDGHLAITLSNGGLHWDQRLLKRSFDLAATIPALILLAPLFLVIAVAIKLDSRGPVFFRQERIGLGNRSFRIWKFRSMRIEMQDPLAIQHTQRDDARVTRVGNFLRRTSLDELPQLFNVLIGEMSLVGPRPHAAMSKAGGALFWEVEQNYWERHVVKPGITGLAQVNGFRGSTFRADDLRNRLDADLIYVMRWSLWQDLVIIFRTFLILGHKNAF